MNRFKNIALACAAAILTACATATPYQPASNGSVGFSSQKVESNRFNVSFSGNSLTSQETVETYLLHRAAELAVENGYDYFTVADEDTQKDTRIIASPSMNYGYSPYGYGGFRSPYYSGFRTSYDFFHPRYGWRSAYTPNGRRGFGNGFYGGFGSPFYDPFHTEFDYRQVTKFKANAEVIMGRGTKPSNDNAFNAHEVLENLGPTIVYPEEKS